MNRAWAYWYPESMGCQERLWCAVRVDDLDEALKSLQQGASGTLPGPAGSAQDLANSNQSARVLSALGWGKYEEQEGDISLEDLDLAIHQIDTLKQDLELEMAGDDFLDLLPFLSNARLVEDNPYAWKPPEGVPGREARALFRMTHEHGAVIATPSIGSSPVLLLSPMGAMKWAPRLMGKNLSDEQKAALN